MNTPKQGSNVCEEHEKTTTKFEDEQEQKISSDEVLGVIKVLEVKETRTSRLYKVRNAFIL